MIEFKTYFGVRIDRLWDLSAWSFGIRISRNSRETYLAIDLFRITICIGKLFKVEGVVEEDDE